MAAIRSARTAETYVAGLGASGALMVGAFVVFLLVIGVIAFNAWPGASSLFHGPDAEVVKTRALPDRNLLQREREGRRSRRSGGRRSWRPAARRGIRRRVGERDRDGTGARPPGRAAARRGRPVLRTRPASPRNTIGGAVQGATGAVGNTINGATGTHLAIPSRASATRSAAPSAQLADRGRSDLARAPAGASAAPSPAAPGRAAPWCGAPPGTSTSLRGSRACS